VVFSGDGEEREERIIMDNTCRTCIYLHPIYEGNRMISAWCRRSAPVTGELMGCAIWPRVILDDWCGEWCGEKVIDKDHKASDKTREQRIVELESWRKQFAREIGKLNLSTRCHNALVRSFHIHTQEHVRDEATGNTIAISVEPTIGYFENPIYYNGRKPISFENWVRRVCSENWYDYLMTIRNFGPKMHDELIEALQRRNPASRSEDSADTAP
jgi:hypothetical protein